MVRRFKLALLAMKIEFHWLLIVRKRAIGTQMLNQGIPVTSHQMLHLSNNLNKHINLAEAARKRYEALIALQKTAMMVNDEGQNPFFLEEESNIRHLLCFIK